MATITGLTAERMREIEAASIVDGAINTSGHLILSRYDGGQIDAGNALAAIPADTVVNYLPVGSVTEVTSPSNYPDGLSLFWMAGDTNATTWPTFAGKWGTLETINWSAGYNPNDTIQKWSRIANSVEPEQWIRSGNGTGWSAWRKLTTKKEFDDRLAPTTVKQPSDSITTYPSGLSMTTMDGSTGPTWSSIPTTQFGTLITANGGDLRSFQLMQVEDGYLHFRRYRSDLSGWQPWTKVLTEQRLDPVNVNQSTTPFTSGKYPWGLSYLYLNDSQSVAGGWSWGSKFGLVTTYRYSNDLIVQTWQKHQGGSGGQTELWQRTASSVGGWSPWRIVVSDAVDDSGWINITPASGFTSTPTSSQHTAQVRRIDKIVRYRGVLTGTVNVNTTTTIGNMPTNPNIPFPLKATNFSFIGNTAANIGWANVTDTGSITTHFKTPYASGTTTLDLNGLSYVID